MVQAREAAREAMTQAQQVAREARTQAHQVAREARTQAQQVAREARLRAQEARRAAERARREAGPARVVIAGQQVAVIGKEDDSDFQLTINSRSILGALFAVIGVASLAESLGAFEFKRVYLWPMLLIAMGLSQLLGRSERQKVEKERSTQLAVAEERVRIARELHDIVAHSVSLMTVQIAAARRVFHIKPEQAETALASAEDTGRQSLTELRNILNVLRSADRSDDTDEGGGEQAETRPLPGLADIPSLVASVRQAGTDVSLASEGEPPTVASSTGVTVYRIVQEALTNAIRHAPGAKVRVGVTYSREQIALVVEDDGPGSETPRGDGHGLIGMRERVQAAGGSMKAGPTSRGWRVEATIPMDPR